MVTLVYDTKYSMAIHRIYLDKASNPEFYKLVEEYNELMDRWNDSNSKILKFKIPRVFLGLTKRRLLRVGKQCHSFQKEYIDWNKRASAFALHPNYKFDSDQNGELVYHHFTNNMKHTINEMRDCVTLLTNNYNGRYVEYKNQINFNIAITAFLVGIIGLGLSLFSIWSSEDFQEELSRSKLPSKIESLEEGLTNLSTRIDSFKMASSIGSEISIILANQAKILKQIDTRDSLSVNQ